MCPRQKALLEHGGPDCVSAPPALPCPGQPAPRLVGMPNLVGVPRHSSVVYSWCIQPCPAALSCGVQAMHDADNMPEDGGDDMFSAADMVVLSMMSAQQQRAQAEAATAGHKA